MGNTEIVRELNNMGDMDQIRQFRSKCADFLWDIHYEMRGKKQRDMRNFHVNINNELLRHIKRTEFVNYLGRKIIRWELWTSRERIYGQYGDIISKMCELMGEKE